MLRTGGRRSADEACVVREWLRTLDLAFYTQRFLDNGYDDLETCARIADADLDAIGVTSAEHRRDILDAVTLLQEQGTGHVYYILEHGERDVTCYPCRDDFTPKGDDDDHLEPQQLLELVNDTLRRHAISLEQAPFSREVSLKSVGVCFKREAPRSVFVLPFRFFSTLDKH